MKQRTRFEVSAGGRGAWLTVRRLGWWLSLVGILRAGQVAATDIYVSTHATPAHPYDTWANAFTNFQEALDYAQATPAVSVIRMAGHVFATDPQGANQYVYRLADRSNLEIIGGYEAAGDTPGNRDPDAWPTVIARAGGDARVMNLETLTDIAFVGVVISNGNVAADGGGVWLLNCEDIVFDTCRIVHNQTPKNAGVIAGGIWLQNSHVTLTNSLVAHNTALPINLTRTSQGGGIFVDANSHLKVSRSMVRDNRAESRHNRNAHGGGIHVAGGTLDVRESVFLRNVVSAPGETLRRYDFGGAIANVNGKVNLRNVLIAGNESTREDGGALYQSGASAVMSLDRCTVVDNISSREVSVGIRYAGGSITISNAIVWGHTYDLLDFPEDGEGRLPGLWYSNTGDGWNAGYQGCHSTDPLFADTQWYHLQSTAGHYTGGFFGGGEWTNALTNSPLIAMGDPEAAHDREPPPHGGRINLGAYGNTEWAAKQPQDVTAPALANPGVHVRARTAAILRGTVSDGGGQSPAVAFEYWVDGTTETNTVALGIRAGAFEYALTGLQPDTDYRYRVSGTNVAAWTASGEQSFFTLPAAIDAWYVSNDGDDSDGASWASAYRNLNWAFANARAGDTIHLAGQVFEGDAPYFNIDVDVFRLANVSNVVIRGGYEALPSLPSEEHPGPRDPEGDQWETVLRRASGDARVLVLDTVSNVVVETITVRDGYLLVRGNDEAFFGGGILVNNSRDVVFDRCRIMDNQIRIASAYGGGIALLDSDAILADCKVLDNTCGQHTHNSGTWGGGAYVNGTSHLTVLRSDFHNNQSLSVQNRTGFGGGLHVAAGGRLDMSASHIEEGYVRRGQASTTGRGGALSNLGTAHLRSVLITGNRSDANHSDGVWTEGAGALTVIESSTVVDNNNGSGIRYGGGVIALTNTIVWGHAEGDLVDFPTDGAGNLLNVSHCLLGAPETMHGVNGCIVGVDPEFAGNGNYRLKDGSSAYDGVFSPAVDAGINLPWMRGAKDLDGFARIRPSRRRIGNRVDIGAYETEPPPGTLIFIR